MPLFAQDFAPLKLVLHDAFFIATCVLGDLACYCYLNKGECNLNQSKDDCFVERVAKNNSWNNGDRQKIHEIFLINCFIFVITLVWRTVHSSAMTQIKAYLMEKNTATNCFQVTQSLF